MNLAPVSVAYNDIIHSRAGKILPKKVYAVHRVLSKSKTQVMIFNSNVYLHKTEVFLLSCGVLLLHSCSSMFALKAPLAKVKQFIFK